MNIPCYDRSCAQYWKDEIEDPAYKTPMPWIGAYVAVASLVCTLAMAADAFRGFRNKKLWFPCKFFTLNAASLTVLAIAMKLPVDLTTSMPGSVDQGAKLSSTAFMCTVIGNFIPSLGTMDDKEILINVIALGILVITIIVNVCIQLYTGVIQSGIYIQQITLVCFMLVLFVILSFTALTIPTMKKYIEEEYLCKTQKIGTSSEQSGKTRNFADEKLEEVKKFWMLAETGSPQFVVARSVTCSASGVICFLAILILVKAMLRIFFTIYQYSLPIQLFGSDYKWSTNLIFLIQCIGVAVGSIAPIFRWFIAIKLKYSENGVLKSYTPEFKIEHYWIERLLQWKDSPLALPIRGQKCKKLVHSAKNLILDFCMGVQIIIVVASKLVLFISIFFINPLLLCYQYCKGLEGKQISETSASKNHIGSRLNSGKMLDPSHYVLNLQGEGKLPETFLNSICDAIDHFIGMGNKKQPIYLIELLKKANNFKGAIEFGIDELVPFTNSIDTLNCWSLSVVSLSSIAIALPNIEDCFRNHFLRSINEGLWYVRIVEKTLDPKGDLINIGNAADVVWLRVELYRNWMDENLQKMDVKGKNFKEIIQRFVDIAEYNIMEFKKDKNESAADPLSWPVKVIASNSMYRIGQTLLLNIKGHKDQTDNKLFEQLSVMIADILGACLTNLPRVITMKCFCDAIEKREESVQHAARLLGETKEILKILPQRELPHLNLDQEAYMNEWGSLIMQRGHLASSVSLSGNDSSISCELDEGIELETV